MSRLVAAVVAVSTLLAAATTTSTITAPARTARADAAPARVTVLGDSTILAMNAGDRAVLGAGFDLQFDAASCRRLVSPSCGRTSQPVSVLPLLRGQYAGRLGQVLVVMAGYDDAGDIGPQIDAIVGEATAQGVARVVWLTYPEDVTYDLPGGPISGAPIFRRHNAALAAAQVRHPQLVVADWATWSAPHPDWFASDGIHLTRAGARGLAEYLHQVLTGLRAQRCVPGLVGGEPVPAGAPTDDAATGGIVLTTPRRLLDTRASGAVPGGRVVRIDTTGVVPADATAVVGTLTAIEPCAAGWLTAFDCSALPPTSNVNFHPGRTTAGTVVAERSPDGQVCVYASSATDVAFDLTGHVTASGADVHLVEPRRWLDTRTAAAVVPSSGALTAGSRNAVPVAGAGGVPAGATGVIANVTLVDPAAPAFASVTPGPCSSVPGTSSVNTMAGRATPATAIVPLGADGSLCVHVSVDAHVVIDVVGWIGEGVGGYRIRPVTSQRLLDTRSGPRPAALDALRLVLDGPGLLNVTATVPDRFGWVLARPCGSAEVTSLVNSVPGEDVANLTAVAPGDGSAICVGGEGATHVVVDRFAALVPAG